MADRPSGLARRYAMAFWLGGSWLAVALLSLIERHRSVYWFVHTDLHDVLARVLSGFPGLTLTAINALEALAEIATGTFVLSLALGTLAIPLGFLARMVALARVRAGHADPLDPVRRASGRHPRVASVLLALPVVATQLLLLDRLLTRGHPWEWRVHFDVVVALLSVAAALVQASLLRSAWRSLLAPGLALAPSALEIDPDEIRFHAVAVTREAQAAVGALAAVSLAMVAWLCTVRVDALFHDRRVFWAIGGYVVTAALGAALFRRASRIAVGLDGLHVGGTSRARFFAYRDLDEVRVRHGELELVRRGRVVLRLQLHGEDAERREAIVTRIRAGIARVADVARDGAANFVKAASARSVARSTQGGAGYRMPAVSREALWALVEGSAVDATARTAAAEAIAHGAAGVDRERLRVAAARVADPRVRVALEELASHEEDGSEAPVGAKRTQTT